VRVPDGVGRGEAKVTVSFAAWKDRSVAPCTYGIKIIDAETAKTEDLAKKKQAPPTGRARIERVLTSIPWDRELQETIRLSDLLEFLKDRYDLEFQLNPADFKVKESAEILQKRILVKTTSKKQVREYLKEWLKDLDATYEAGDTGVRIVPAHKRK
jgi:hypothetical protein